MALNGDAAELFREVTREIGTMKADIIKEMGDHHLETTKETGRVWGTVREISTEVKNLKDNQTKSFERLPCKDHDKRIDCASRWQKIGVAIGASIMIIIPLLLYLWKAKP